MRNASIYIGLTCLLTSCYSFDKEIALKTFKELKPDCEIVEMADHECDGSPGECWYVDFKYKSLDSETVYDTTLQFWKKGDMWISTNEKIPKDTKPISN